MSQSSVLLYASMSFFASFCDQFQPFSLKKVLKKASVAEVVQTFEENNPF